MFISYSHENSGLVEAIVATLQKNGLRPMWDRNFRGGRGLLDEVKNFIEHAHVFMPFITEASGRRGWVHQEIGYAKALNIPVLPLTTGEVPGELLQGLLAVPFDEDQARLAAALCWKLFHQRVTEAQERSRPLHYLAEDPEGRTAMMVDYATRVVQLGDHGHVRQKGGLSSFNIPDEIPEAEVWKERYGVHYNVHRCKAQRKERQALEQHARKKGCSLIVDDSLSFKKFGAKSTAARLRTLIAFLEAMTDDAVRVAVARPDHAEHHLTLVGDWFAAEAVSATMVAGIRHTIFTRHAATLRSKIESFDQELDHHLRKQGISAEKSRVAAIKRLRSTLRECLADRQAKSPVSTADSQSR